MSTILALSRKSADFASKFRERIQCGDLEPGARLPSFSELRREHGIAPATAERIYMMLENEGSAIRKQGVGTFVAQPGKQNGGAPAETGVKSGLIGFVARGVQQRPRPPIWSHLLEGVHDAVSRQEKRVVLLSYDSDLVWHSVEGVLFADVLSNEALQQRPTHLPCMVLQYSQPGIATVMADEFEAGRMATQHLLDLGHRRIAVLFMGFADQQNSETVSRRYSGYQDALRSAGIRPRAEWERFFIDEDPVHTECGYREMRRWFQDGWRQTGSTAIVALNDQIALGALRALQEDGINVPDLVSIVGFDGTEFGLSCVPPLTSVRMPVEEIATEGNALLMRQIESGEQTAQRVMIWPDLLICESTAAPPENA